VSDSRKILGACFKELKKYGFEFCDTDYEDDYETIVSFMDDEWTLNCNPPTFSVARNGCYDNLRDFDIRDPNDFSVERVVDVIINDLFQYREYTKKRVEGLRKMVARRDGIISP